MKTELEHVLRQMKNMPEAQPDKGFRVNAKVRVLNVAGSWVSPTPGGWWRRVQYQISRAAIGGTLGVALMGTSVVYAAQFSSPGSALYPVKVASEDVALTLAPTKHLKTTVATTVIDRRAKEVEELKSTGSTGDVSHAISDFRDTVDRAEHLSGVDSDEVARHIKEHEDLLESNDATKSGTKSETHEEDSEDRKLPPSPTTTPALLLMPTAKIEVRENASTVEGAHTTSEDEGSKDAKGER